MPSVLGKNMKARMKSLGMTQAELGERVGLTQAAIQKLVSGKARGTTKIHEIAQALQCSPSDLLYPVDQSTNVSEPPAKYNTGRQIPLISWVQAGEMCESPDIYPPGDAEDWLPGPRTAGPHTFALRVVNDSMQSNFPGQRSYPEGTIIYVDPDKALTNGCRVVAKANGEYTFKSYVEDAGRKYLKPINTTYDKIDVTEDTHICGVVIGSFLPE